MYVMKKLMLAILPALLLAGCSVKEKEMEVSVFQNTVTSVYTGKVKRKLPEGEGTAVLENNAVAEGLFEQGAWVSGTADKVPYSISYNNGMISGTYTGEVAEQLPSGSGTFTSDALTFEGTWNNGVPDGPGTLSAQSFQIGALDGSYTGDVDKGMSEGNGTFVYSDDEHEVTMEGSFAGSMFDGLLTKTVRYGETEKSYPVFYQKGQEVHDTAAMIAYLEGMRNTSYCLSEAQLSFIQDHTALFNGTAKDSDLPKEYAVFNRDSFKETDAPSLILIRNAAIRSVQRYKPYEGADTVTSLIVENSDGYYHLVFAYGVTKADRGDIVDICALPLCKSTLTAPEQDYPAIDAAGAVVFGG
jgi:hypothetical protein